MASDIEIADMMRTCVPDDGTPISNYAVMKQLASRLNSDFGRDRYFAIRQMLIERGELEAVHGGYGGRVARCRPVVPLVPDQSEPDDWRVERHLYSPFQRYLRFRWPKQASTQISDQLLTQIVEIHDPMQIDLGPFLTC